MKVKMKTRARHRDGSNPHVRLGARGRRRVRRDDDVGGGGRRDGRGRVPHRIRARIRAGRTTKTPARGGCSRGDPPSSRGAFVARGARGGSRNLRLHRLGG